jgi:hypothetical protein
MRIVSHAGAAKSIDCATGALPLSFTLTRARRGLE